MATTTKQSPKSTPKADATPKPMTAAEVTKKLARTHAVRKTADGKPSWRDENGVNYWAFETGHMVALTQDKKTKVWTATITRADGTEVAKDVELSEYLDYATQRDIITADLKAQKLAA